MLDVGSGAGDVALVAAEAVGETGAVVGVDLNAFILDTARARVDETGHRNVTFVPGDIRTIELEGSFDAIIGRAVLMYMADPTAALRRSHSLLRPGGKVAFLEYDNTLMLHSHPHVPFADTVRYWISETVRRAGIDEHICYKLRNLFLDSGLPEPELQQSTMFGGGPDWSGYHYAAESLRSMMPNTIRFGIATAEEINVETLGDRLRDEVVSRNATLMGSAWVSAWAQV